MKYLNYRVNYYTKYFSTFLILFSHDKELKKPFKALTKESKPLKPKKLRRLLTFTFAKATEKIPLNTI